MRHSDEFSGDDDRQYLDDAELDAALDEDFPLGNGTAETDTIVACPYCGELVTLLLDPGGGTVQEYVEDCQICCQPWLVTVSYREDGNATVLVRSLDGE
jgi:hypothetical protein